jgi:uncharacterized lipoprotein
MKPVAAVVFLLALAGCGADGEPIRPAADAGVSITSGGVYPWARVGVSTGPFWLSLGL